MQEGTVIRFNKIKGYGFIKSNSESEEIFVHFSEVQTEGYKELTIGQRVSYVLKKGDKGGFATQVQILD
jgi:CspA family cold shock protein